MTLVFICGTRMLNNFGESKMRTLYFEKDQGKKIRKMKPEYDEFDKKIRRKGKGFDRNRAREEKCKS